MMSSSSKSTIHRSTSDDQMVVDSNLMPPPAQLFVPESLEFHEALASGFLHLSLPETPPPLATTTTDTTTTTEPVYVPYVRGMSYNNYPSSSLRSTAISPFNESKGNGSCAKDSSMSTTLAARGGHVDDDGGCCWYIEQKSLSALASAAADAAAAASTVSICTGSSNTSETSLIETVPSSSSSSSSSSPTRPTSRKLKFDAYSRQDSTLSTDSDAGSTGGGGGTGGGGCTGGGGGGTGCGVPTTTTTTTTTAVCMETTRFGDIIGHGSVKVRIHEILLSLSPSLAHVLTGIRAVPASVLLHGPPGCGKTKLARAIAGEARAAFLPVAPSDILSKYVGESEARVRDLFACAWEQALQLESKCAVIFLDEIDALGQSRGGNGGGGGSSGGGGEGSMRRVLAELLLQLNIIADRKQHQQLPYRRYSPTPQEGDNMECESFEEEEGSIREEPGQQARIIVVAATNRLQDCDPALLRRFGIKLHVGLPNKKHRKQLLVSVLGDIHHAITREEFDMIAAESEGWSGSDLESLIREAAMAPVRECIRNAALMRNRTEKRRSVLNGSLELQDPDGVAQEFLDSSLRTMRPIVLQDFERAAAFWLYNGQSSGMYHGPPLGAFSPEYDSSDEED